MRHLEAEWPSVLKRGGDSPKLESTLVGAEGGSDPTAEGGWEMGLSSWGSAPCQPHGDVHGWADQYAESREQRIL